MPEFPTPQPISLSVDLGVGHITITASDRTDTVVDVAPTDPTDDSDVKAAAQVRTDLTSGRLTISGPRTGVFDFSRKSRSVDISVEIPSGSSVSTRTQMGDVRATGRLGDSSLSTSMGSITLGRTGALTVKTPAGDVSVDEVDGSATLSTGTGRLHIGTVSADAELKNSNGDTTIGAADGDVRIRSANGHIRIGAAGGAVDAKTAMGDVRVGSITRGSSVLETSLGDLEIGIASGTAAWLDVTTAFGHVRNDLVDAIGPEDADETAEIRGRTSTGSITIHRATTDRA
ncbi:DUF4097 family beta strand repeat-containing protein [Gordonia soli]|uniref:DUF4097 domain-containing protein n=1 Tax=Gordonia soli NBRC 108243 TaxID=1223545 RepID=M0QF89_9ACTN|nr:DUF4097 family beta strand repeat-containing protein [Gordonia soli]GAC67270.1 hypothetical protein GS4_07_00190 [Gordonia soli NBRC 108243]